MSTTERQSPPVVKQAEHSGSPAAIGGHRTPRQLMLRRFKRHTPAVVSLFLLALTLLCTVFCEFLAPYDPHVRDATQVFAPPNPIRFVDAEGRFHLRPFVYPLVQHFNAETFRRTYTLDHSRRLHVRFFVDGDPYMLWGLFELRTHLFGFGETDDRAYLLGTDNAGRDMLSRMLYGSRISLSVGLVGVSISLLLGLVIGGLSGYYGGYVDVVVQRVIEVFRSLPFIPVWMALSAAVPPHWPQLRVYFAITLILSLVGWIGLARVVRGKFLALREEEFVMAARTSGASSFRIIRRHLVPSFASHIIAVVTLSVPSMILGETALSFLGIGLRAPMISWGVLLQQAQNVRTVVLHPWLMLPALLVVVVILAFNFAGDGLRDAADPYGSAGHV